MNNYIIPYSTRDVQIDRIVSKHKLMVVDGIGIIVHYHETEPTDSIIRQHLIGYKSHKMRIEAPNLEDALKQFYELDAAQCGDKFKAYTLETSESYPIIEYCGCDHMGVDMNCTYFDDEHTSPDSFLLCILNGCDDVHDGCPIKQQMDRPSEVVHLNGVWVRRYDNRPQVSLW